MEKWKRIERLSDEDEDEVSENSRNSSESEEIRCDDDTPVDLKQSVSEEPMSISRLVKTKAFTIKDILGLEDKQSESEDKRPSAADRHELFHDGMLHSPTVLSNSCK